MKRIYPHGIREIIERRMIEADPRNGKKALELISSVGWCPLGFYEVVQESLTESMKQSRAAKEPTR